MLLRFLGLQVVAPCLGLGFVRMGEAIAANLGPQGAFRSGVLLPPEPLAGRGRNLVAATAGAEHGDRLTGFRDSVNGYTKIALDRKQVYLYTYSMKNKTAVKLASSDLYVGHDGQSIKILRQDGREVAHITLSGYRTGPDGEVLETTPRMYADLFAAAPDLLAALIAVRGLIDSKVNTLDGGANFYATAADTLNRLSKMGPAIDAAIAKAEGR